MVAVPFRMIPTAYSRRSGRPAIRGGLPSQTKVRESRWQNCQAHVVWNEPERRQSELNGWSASKRDCE
jgi:hypothetical protein